jgi:hypothetical protein
VLSPSRSGGVSPSRTSADLTTHFRPPHLTAWFAGAAGVDVDAALEIIAIVGGAAAAAVVCGVIVSPLLALCWVAYLSLFVVGQTFLSFQWDIFLLELGFLGCLYAPLLSSEGLRPSPAVRWALRFLIFKLMIMAGAVKVAAECPTWQELTALEFHYATQCLPTPLAWFAHQAPPFLQRLSVAATLVIEIPGALLLLSPFGVVRRVGVAMQVLLQALIAATGNYTFFNVLTVVACVPCLDDSVLPSGLRRALCPVSAASSSSPSSSSASAAAAAPPPLRSLLSRAAAALDAQGPLLAARQLLRRLDRSRAGSAVALTATLCGLGVASAAMFSLRLAPWPQWAEALSAGTLWADAHELAALRLAMSTSQLRAWTARLLPAVFCSTLCAALVGGLSHAAAEASGGGGDGGDGDEPDITTISSDSHRGSSGSSSERGRAELASIPEAASGRAAPPPRSALLAACHLGAGAQALFRLALACVLILLSAGPLNSVGAGLPAPAALLGPRVVEAASHFHVNSGYGLFRRMTGVGRTAVAPGPEAGGRRRTGVARPEVILAGSVDGTTWHELSFRWKPGNLSVAPGWVAPHQPRLDWQMWFAALASYQHNPWLLHLMTQILDGGAAPAALLAPMPAAFRGRPPTLLRADLWHYDFTRWDSPWARETPDASILGDGGSAWWARRHVREYLPPISQGTSGLQQVRDMFAAKPPALPLEAPACGDEPAAGAPPASVARAAICSVTRFARRQEPGAPAATGLVLLAAVALVARRWACLPHPSSLLSAPKVKQE